MELKNNLLYLMLLCCTFLYSADTKLAIKDMKAANFPLNDIIIEADIATFASYNSKDISFMVNDIKQYGLMSIPTSPKPKNGYPVIILIHGHIPPKQYSTLNSYKYMFNRYATSEFVVIKPDLRSHGRSGAGGNYNVGIEKLYFLEDMLQLIKSLETLDYVNTDEIFIMGHSNGGDSALRILSVLPNTIKAASMWAPVTVNLEESNFYYKGKGRDTYGLDAITDPRAQEEIDKFGIKLDGFLKDINIGSRSEVRTGPYLSEIKTPIKIRHPDTDAVVPYSWSVDFVKRFEQSGNTYNIEIINYHGDDHNIAKNQSDAQRDDLNWFRSFLNRE